MKHLLFFFAFLLLVFSVTSQTLIINPKHGISTARGLRMDTLAINDTATIISFHNETHSGNWISIPNKTYILPVGSKDTLFITGTQNIPFNKKYTMTETGFIDFKVILPALPKGISHFDYGEANSGGTWFIYNIPTTISSSTMPSALAGNWYDKETGDWVLGLLDDIAIYKNTAWSYVDISFKRNKGIIRLKLANQQIELFVKNNKKGDLFIGESKNEASVLSRTVKETSPSKEVFTEPIFNMDTAVYSGYIEGYCARAGFKTISVAVNDILTGEQNTLVTTIEPDGQFTFSLPLYYPHMVFVRSKVYNGSIFLEPGKSLFHYISSSSKDPNFNYMGPSATINANLQKLQKISGPNYTKIRGLVMDMSQEEYKSYLLKELDLKIKSLDTLREKETIDTRACQVKQLDLTYRYYSKIFEYRWDYESAYRKKNNIPRSQRQLEITYDIIPDQFYDFITPELTNNPIAVLSTDYGSFINRLKFADFLRPSNFRITTKMLLDETKKRGTTLTADEEQLSEALDRSDELKNAIDQSGQNKKHNAAFKAFNEKYKVQIMKIYRKAREQKHTVENLKTAMLDEGIELSNEEIKMFDARAKIQESALGKKLAEEQKTISRLSSKFHKDHRDMTNEYFASMRKKSRNEKLRTICGIEKGLILDIMNSQDIGGNIVSNFSPLEEQKLLLQQATFTTPFVGEYLAYCNESTKAKIRANKLKSDYTLNDVPKTDADKVFDEILKKYKGKLVYVDFWATWCSPCRSGISRIKPLKEEIADWDVAFVYITNQSSPEKTFNNMIPDIKGQHYRLSEDDWNYLKGKFNISGIPHYVLVGKDGNVINPKLGHKSNEALKSLFEKYLK